jgi:hypothetical protein
MLLGDMAIDIIAPLLAIGVPQKFLLGIITPLKLGKSGDLRRCSVRKLFV